jgi:hypothetical protein
MPSSKRIGAAKAKAALEAPLTLENMDSPNNARPIINP